MPRLLLWVVAPAGFTGDELAAPRRRELLSEGFTGAAKYLVGGWKFMEPIRKTIGKWWFNGG